MSDNQACEVPLVELLRGIAQDYEVVIPTQWMQDGTEIGHRYIQVGRLMHEAADRIGQLERENAALQAEVSRLTENQLLQDSATAAVMERAEKAEAEVKEQARLLSMSSEREARLLARVAELEKALLITAKTDLINRVPVGKDREYAQSAINLALKEEK